MKGQVYKVSSLANGEVSVVFHVRGEDAEAALKFLALRGRTLKLELSKP